MTTATTPDTSATGHSGLLPAPGRLRLPPIGACWTLYVFTLRQHLHGRRWMALALLFLLPIGLAILFRATGPGIPSRFLEFILTWILIPQALLPLAALLYASGIIQDEQEEQTITYLLTRPIPKWLLYAVKMAATCTTTALLVVVLTMLTYAAIYAGSSADLSEVWLRCVKAAAILSLAAVTYCSIFGAIGLLTKRTLIVGILYIVIVEGLLAAFPLSLRWGTVIYYTRIMAYRTMDFVVTWPNGRSNDDAATTWLLNVKTDPTLAEHPTLKTCILTLLVISLVSTMLAGWLCSQSEFHVKTPEKQ
jgi:ABC-2 type transport system permease protein